MESVLLAAALAASAHGAAATGTAAPLDVACFGLMAGFAEDEDPRVRDAGRVAAQYFLGRIDAAQPGFEPAAAPDAGGGPAREALLRRCGEAMEAGGRDFRRIGETLAPGRRPTA